MVGDATCAPVGVTEIPEGFALEESTGWGMRAVLPSAPCEGATIALLGTSECVAIDEGAEAFPPKGASIVVRKSGPVTTIADALGQAGPRDTIAIDEGEFELPPSIDKSITLVGRGAEKTSLRGLEFGVRVPSDSKVTVKSVAIVGSPKASVIADKGAFVTLDRVYVKAMQNGAMVANRASIAATRTVFEGPTSPRNPNAATSGLYPSYEGVATLDRVEIRGFQLGVLATSVGSKVTITSSVIHEQRALDAEPEALSVLAAFTGAKLLVERSHIESAPGRIAMIGAARLDGSSDPTSKDDPPASLEVKHSTLVHANEPREAGSAIDTIDGASVTLDGVSLHHECFVGIGSGEGSTVTVKNSTITNGPTKNNARIALSGLSRGNFVVTSSALVGTAQFAILLDGASTADVEGSLVTGNREIGVKDYGLFMGAAQAISLGRSARADIRDSAFVGNQGSSVFLQEGSAQIDRAVFTTTTATTGSLSAAITAIDAKLAVRNSILAKNDRALAIRHGRALLRDSTVADHKEALRLEGLALFETSDPLDDAEDQKLVSSRTTFARNAIHLVPKALSDE